MSNSISKRAGRRALAALLSVALVTTGAVASPMIATAQTVSVTGESPRGTAEGTGAGILSAGKVTPGGILTITGTSFAQRPATGGSLAFKINDGALKFPADQSGTDAASVDGTGTAYTDGANLPDAGGNFSADFRVPADLQLGYYWVRVLGGNDGGESASKYAWFEVVAAPEPLDITSSSTAANGDVTAVVAASGLAASSTLTVTANGTPGKFVAGRSTADTAQSDASGAFSGSVVLPAGSALAGADVTLKLSDAEGGSSEASFTALASVALTSTAANTSTDVTVGNLPAGATVNFVGVDGTNFLSTAQQGKAAGADNKALIEGVNIPASAANYGKPIQVTYTVSSSAITQNSGSVVSPDNSQFNAEGFTVQSVDIPAGLYQSAYSAKEDALFVTRSVGRPPITETSLIKINPNTLETIASVEPALVGEGPGRYGFYGVGLDDELGLVWATNTRQNTVSVYKQSDLSLVKQFEDGSSTHSRDAIVDPETNLAYVSNSLRGGGATGVIDIYDGKKLEKVGSINLENFGTAMSLDFDPETGNLFTVSLDQPKIAVINVRDGNKVDIHTIDDANVVSGSGVTWDKKNGNVWIANQGSNNTVVYNLKSKEATDLPTGGGALNAKYDPIKGVVYVINRGGGTVTVFNAKTLERVGNIEVGGNANHVSIDGKGNAYAVNKLNGGTDEAPTNKLVKITPNKDYNEIDNGSSNGSSEGIGGILGIILSVGAIATVVGGLFSFLFNSGILSKDLIPAPIRQALGL